MEWIELLQAEDRRAGGSRLLALGTQVVIHLAAAENDPINGTRIDLAVRVRQDFLEAGASKKVSLPGDGFLPGQQAFGGHDDERFPAGA